MDSSDSVIAPISGHCPNWDRPPCGMGSNPDYRTNRLWLEKGNRHPIFEVRVNASETNTGLTCL